MTSPSGQLQQLAQQAARDLARQLAEHQCRIVLAESCTCGLVAALLGQCPGISNWLCGSWVTYRESAKQQWLGIGMELLESKSAESIEVTEALAEAALLRSPEAGLGVAVTGHLGPDAPVDRDGRIFVASIDDRHRRQACQIELVERDRVSRQFEAARCVLDWARVFIS